MTSELIGCGEFDKDNPELMRSCGDILFSNKIWICKGCRTKKYSEEQKRIIEQGDKLK